MSDDHLGRHLILTAGSFLSYAGSATDPEYSQVSGIIQPGNEGGPLVDDGGNVLGVMVDKHTLLASLSSRQDPVSYAVREELLFAFLTRNGIRPAESRDTSVPTGTTRREDIGAAGIVEIVGKAIVPVVCVRRAR